MNCFLLNNETNIKDIPSNGKARLCYVDVDVLIASAPENLLDRRDSLLAQKFEAAYSNEYITLNEKTGANIFQVFGIKAQKIKRVYALIPSHQVDCFIPYAIALRTFLHQKETDMSQMTVVIDDQGDEKLITVFDGLKFSRTRSIHSNQVDEILPDIKRSAIDFNKKLGEFARHKETGEFRILTNNALLAQEIKIAEPKLCVDLLDCPNPAVEGLKFCDSQMKYRIPEEIIRERKMKEQRSMLMHGGIAIGILISGVIFFGCSQMNYSIAVRNLEDVRTQNTRLLQDLNEIDQRIYRDALRKTKKFNYASLFFEESSLLPSTYEIASFKFNVEGDQKNLETYVFSQDDQFYDEIPRVKIFKDAQVKNFYIKNRPGKYLRITL